jgi:hypothetical protein
MNKSFQSLLCTALLALGAFLFAQSAANAALTENPQGYNAFAGTGTAQGTTNSYYIVGNYTVAGTSTPIVRYLNASSDAAAGKIQFYTVTNQVTINNPTNSGATNLVCSSTNGFAAGDIVVIKHVLLDTYERLPLFLVQNTNQLVVKYPPATTCSVGDLLWRANPTGAIPIGAATNSVPTGAGLFLYAGQYGKPLLIEVGGTSTATLNAVSGDFK